MAMSTLDTIKAELAPCALRVLNLCCKSMELASQMDTKQDDATSKVLSKVNEEIQDATRQATIELKGDTRQLIAAMILQEPTPKSIKAAHKLMQDKWWRTTDGVPTSRNPALDGKQGQLTISMEIDKRGHAFHIDYDAKVRMNPYRLVTRLAVTKATIQDVCDRVDPMIDATGIWKLPKMGGREKWGPVLLSFGSMKTKPQDTLDSLGITPGCVLFATHLRIRKRKRDL